MKLFNWIFAKTNKQKNTQPEFVFESWETKAKRYDDMVKALDTMRE
ncbi:hypothetical protein SAMN02910293_00446 [Streptococcus henryi]|uniref:Uncharacterized protein n=1 Tax=Streptococcus henryi TaxID=439219 RepID=A0A1G6AKJ3_9STRE|nr:hypothetical protein [Streptococcus henryi]QBX25343.1 hypothetical protein Javan252_0042 [Streptococcus phage Javan252]SDB08958.1 hypothetical protein SAMN02910293_00446 [Streptococcus henryi]